MDEWLNKALKRISKEQRLALISTFVTGIIVHLFMLSNKIPNHDDIGQLYDAMNRYRHGRWFLFFPSKLSSDLSLPWFNGVLGIFYISFCVMIIVWLFQVKSSICIVAIGAIMVTFPTVASTFNYMQAGDAYFFCLLLSCIAVCFAKNSSKLCWFAAVVLLTLSLGIYQSYLPFAVGLLVIWHIKELLLENEEVKKVLYSGIRCVCIVAMAVFSYLIISNLLLKYHNTEINSHMEGFMLDDLSIKNILRLVVEAYKNAMGFYLVNDLSVHYNYLKYFNLLAGVFAVLFGFFLYKRDNQKKSRTTALLLIVLYVILPLASGLIYCMCAKVHMLMIYGFVVLALFPLLLADWIEKSDVAIKGSKVNLIQVGQIVIVVTAFIISYNYALVSNKTYLSLFLTYEQSYAYANRLMTEIQMQDEFDKDDKLLLIGHPILNIESTMPWREEKDVQSMKGVPPSLINQNTFDRFLSYYCGVEQEVSQITSLEELKDLDIGVDINDLNYYPSAGSIICDGDMVLVRFSDVQ